MGVPAGWYPHEGVLRYWDGEGWTEHTAPAAPQAPVTARRSHAAPVAARTPGYRNPWIVGPVSALAGILLGAGMAGGDAGSVTTTAAPAGTIAPLAAQPGTTVTETATATATATVTKKAKAKTKTVTKKVTAPTTRRTTAAANTDPRFGTCGAANDAGYGNYQQGVDPEYDWYDDRDDDGWVCEF